jgi:uncharacterized damage-inducible protein DinB
LNTETARIADQLRRAFDGSAWHGPSLGEVLADVDAATAAAQPLPDVHSIWEQVLHVAAWDQANLRRLGGKKAQPEGLQNFPRAPRSGKASESAWRKAVKETRRAHSALLKAVSALPDSRLSDRVPGKRYDFYFLLHGAVQHKLYHAGQIAILKKARLRP